MAIPFILRSKLRGPVFLASCRSCINQSPNRAAEPKGAEAFGKLNSKPDGTTSMLESGSRVVGDSSPRPTGNKL